MLSRGAAGIAGAPRRVLAPLLALLLLLLLAVGSWPSAASGQSPSFYITFHGGKSGVNNAYSYELDGSLRCKGVLRGDSSNELRGLLLLPDWTLLLANAHKSDSRLSHFGHCDADGMRDYLGDFADDAHLAHPYGLAITPNTTARPHARHDAALFTDAADDVGVGVGMGRRGGAGLVFASNQGSSAVVSYNLATGAFAGVVADFGSDEVRDLALDPRRDVLYVANKDQSAAVAIDLASNTISSNLSFTGIKKPIGLWIDADNDVLYIGSNGKTGAVYSYSLVTRQLLHVFQDASLSHPAGMLTHGDSLYVLSQDTLSLLRFSTVTGQLTGVPISNLPDTPEQIFFSPC